MATYKAQMSILTSCTWAHLVPLHFNHTERDVAKLVPGVTGWHHHKLLYIGRPVHLSICYIEEIKEEQPSSTSNNLMRKCSWFKICKMRWYSSLWCRVHYQDNESDDHWPRGCSSHGSGDPPPIPSSFGLRPNHPPQSYECDGRPHCCNQYKLQTAATRQTSSFGPSPSSPQPP